MTSAANALGSAGFGAFPLASGAYFFAFHIQTFFHAESGLFKTYLERRGQVTAFLGTAAFLRGPPSEEILKNTLKNIPESRGRKTAAHASLFQARVPVLVIDLPLLGT